MKLYLTNNWNKTFTWNLRQRKELLRFKVFFYLRSPNRMAKIWDTILLGDLRFLCPFQPIKMNFLVLIQIRQDNISQVTDKWFEIAGQRSLSINLKKKITLTENNVMTPGIYLGFKPKCRDKKETLKYLFKVVMLYIWFVKNKIYQIEQYIACICAFTLISQ